MKKSFFPSIIALAFFSYFTFLSISTESLSSVSESILSSEDFFWVKKVIDGDTIIVSQNGAEYRVRLIGIDAPEKAGFGGHEECFAIESTQYLTQLLKNDQIRLKNDPTQDNKDRYDRLLRYVFDDNDQHINALMIKNGFAAEYTYDKPYHYQKKFQRLEKEAIETRLGIWNETKCRKRRDEKIPSLP